MLIRVAEKAMEERIDAYRRGSKVTRAHRAADSWANEALQLSLKRRETPAQFYAVQRTSSKQSARPRNTYIQFGNSVARESCSRAPPTLTQVLPLPYDWRP